MKLKNKPKGQVLLLIAVELLALIGCVFIYSASNYSALATYNDKFYFVKKQVIGVVLGTIAMMITSLYDYKKIKKLMPYVCILSIILLALVFVPGLGIENYGAKRWIGLGGFTIQPSEIAKFALILFIATYFSTKPERIYKFSGILPAILFGGLLCALIIIEPNMSITMCVALLLIGMLLVLGMKIKHFIMLLLPLCVGVVLLIILEPYRLLRLSAFLDPWASPKGEGYQLLQSLYALGNGGWFGVGLFNSRQKYAFLPFAESDFILSVIGEEVGFVGLIFIFFIIGLIIYKGIKIASKSRDIFGFAMATGTTLIFGIQACINALVVTGSIPPTGLSLPLVSSGNTSIIIFMAEMGVLYNISKHNSLTF